MSTRLTISLPDDVWQRLNEEALEAGMTIGPFLRKRVITRDKNRNKSASPSSVDPSNEREK